MESLVEVHECAICGRECVITLVSIGTPHQWVAQVICPDCITPEHLRRVGKHPAQTVRKGDEEAEEVE